MGFLSSIFGSSNKSSSSATTTSSATNQADNRVVLGNDAVQVGAGGFYSSASNSNNSSLTEFLVNDSSSRDYSTSNNTEFRVDDSSSRDYSTSTSSSTSFQVDDSSSRDYSTHYTGTDGGAVQIAGFNSQLLKSISENQGDTVKFLAQMGADGISKQAGAATDLFATSSTAAGAAWGHTIDKSGELIDKLLMTAQGTVAGANAVASQAVASFTPTANKNADTFKYAAIAAALLIAYKVFKG